MVTIIDCASAAADVYHKEARLKTVWKRNKKAFLSFDKKWGEEFYAALYENNRKEYILAIRGTLEGIDWLENLNFFADNRILREKFFGILKTQYDDLISYYKKVIDYVGSGKLFVTGHSLGGMLAKSLAYSVDKQLPTIAFDSPGIGQFIKRLKRSGVRVYDKNCKNICTLSAKDDIVRRLGSHTGSQIVIDMNLGIKYFERKKSSSCQDMSRVKKLFGPWQELVKNESKCMWEYHFKIQHSIENLRNVLQKCKKFSEIGNQSIVNIHQVAGQKKGVSVVKSGCSALFYEMSQIDKELKDKRRRKAEIRAFQRALNGDLEASIWMIKKFTY